jgi:hypothetical protein
MRHFFPFFAASLAIGTVAYGCSSSNGGGGGAADGGTDGATSDVVGHKDAIGPYDSGGSGDDSSASACPTPADVSKFTPPAYKHAKHVPTACTAQNLKDYDTDCLNATSKNQATCTSWKTANATCYGCLVSQETDATWGALVSHNGVLSLNTAGCVELTDPTDTACAPADQGQEACIEAACDTQCPVKDQTSFTNYQACVQTAASQGCGTFISTANTACSSVATSAASAVCFPSSSGTFETNFAAIAPIFCGGGSAGDGGAPEGGGTDAAGDAPAD